MASVGEALKKSPKGQLYGSGTNWSHMTESMKKKFLEDISKRQDVIDGLADQFSVLLNADIPLDDNDDVSDDVASSLDDLVDTSDLLRSPLITMREEELTEYQRMKEEELMREYEERINLRRKILAENRDKIGEEMEMSAKKRELKMKYIQMEEQMKMMEEEKLLYERVEKDMKIRNELQLIHDQELEDIKRCKKAQLERDLKIEMEKKREMEAKLREGYTQLRSVGGALIDKMVKMANDCKYPDLLEKNVMIKIQEMVGQVNEIIHKEINLEDEGVLKYYESQMKIIGDMVNGLGELIEEANKEGEAERERREKEENKRKQVEAEQKKQLEKEREQKIKESSTNKKFVIPKSGISQYHRLRDLLETTNDRLASGIGTNPELKMYRFNLQRGVALIGSISSQSGGQLIAKINQVKQLLDGKSITIGGKQISVNEHGDAKLFCLNLLAKKLVDHSEDEPSPFPLAAAVVYFWSTSPEFGDLFLAHCYNTCPILVPIYFNKTNDMTEFDYLKLSGYRTSEFGKEELYLNRMKNCVSLYSAVLHDQPFLLQNKPHPHGLGHGWTLLARILNMEPRPGITAAALLGILEICGFALFNLYGRQFEKLLSFINNDYLPRIDKITTDGQRASFEKLRQFLEDCIKNKSIPQPKGMLTQRFWADKRTEITSA
jgi:nucleoporin GLE1